MLPTRLFACILLFALTAACATSDATFVEDLDVTTPAEKEAGKITIPPSAVTNWQNFFRAPPSTTERHDLASKIETWEDSESAETLLKKGRAELALGRLKAAETSFRRVLRLDAANYDASLELASVYIKRDDSGRAFEFLAAVKEAIASRDDVTEAFITKYRYTLALAYLGRGDAARGHEILSDLIGKDKTFAPAYTALAASYLKHGKISLAEFIVLQALDRTEPSASLYNILGVIHRKKDEVVAARKWFDKSLELSATYAPALVNRAELALSELEYDAAEADLNHAIALDPTQADALVVLGVVKKKQGNIKAAQAAFEKAIDAMPDNATARYNLGILYADHFKKPTEAERLFSEVIQIAPQSSDLHKKAESLIAQIREHKERL